MVCTFSCLMTNTKAEINQNDEEQMTIDGTG